MRASRSLVAGGVDHQQRGVRVALRGHAGQGLLEPRAGVVGDHDHHDRRDGRLDLVERTAGGWSPANPRPPQGSRPARRTRITPTGLATALTAAERARPCRPAAALPRSDHGHRSRPSAAQHLLRQRRLRRAGLPEGPGSPPRAREATLKPQVDAVGRHLRVGHWSHRGRRQARPAPDHYAPAGCDSPTTPRPCSGPAPAWACSPPRCLSRLAGRPGLDIVAFGVTWRGRSDLAGRARPPGSTWSAAPWPPGPCGRPGRRARRAPDRVVDRSRRRRPRAELRGAAQPGGGRASSPSTTSRACASPSCAPATPSSTPASSAGRIAPGSHRPRRVAVRGRRGHAPSSPSAPTGSWSSPTGCTVPAERSGPPRARPPPGWPPAGAATSWPSARSSPARTCPLLVRAFDRLGRRRPRAAPGHRRPRRLGRRGPRRRRGRQPAPDRIVRTWLGRRRAAAGAAAGGRRVRLPVPLRGLRPASARGHGQRHAGGGDRGRAPCPRCSATPPCSCRAGRRRRAGPRRWADVAR